MEILSRRRWYTPTSTISELFLGVIGHGGVIAGGDGITPPALIEAGATFSTGPAIRECFILEDTVRAPGVKIQNETAIPAARYCLIVDWSNRFQKYAFHILNVPNFTGVRLHSGNTAVDTDGCLLAGRDRGLNCVEFSHVAFIALWAKLTEEAGWDAEHDCMAFRMKEETWITIVNDPTPETDTRQVAA